MGSIHSPAQWVERIWYCCSCGIGCRCSSDLVPGPGTSICCQKKKMCYMMSCFVTWHDIVLHDTTSYYMMSHLLHGVPYMTPPHHMHWVIWHLTLHDAGCVIWHHLMLYGITLFYAQLTKCIIFKTAFHQRWTIISLSSEALGRPCINFAPVSSQRATM